MADPLNPLSEQHLSDINTAITNADAALIALNKAERAGIEVKPYRDQLNDALTRLRTIKQVYFPGR